MEIETTIIGAGVIGLAIAAQLSEKDKNILLIERNTTFGEEISSRNSEVIHAGIYYPKDSLKAKLCVEGNRHLRLLCKKKRIPHRMCGKLIVATRDEEISQLEALAIRARDNGVNDLVLKSKEECQQLEPQVQAKAGLYSPSTGIIDSRRLMRQFIAQAKRNGVNLVYQTQVTKVEKTGSSKYKIEVVYPDGKKDSFTTSRLINAAGLNADKIAETMGIDIDQCGYRQHFWKGEYFSIEWPKDQLKHLVYPVPEPQITGLGVHATIDLSGRIKLGPNARYMPDHNIDYAVDPGGRDEFFNAARIYLPTLKKEELAPEMAGIRPKLQQPGDPVKDFIINEESPKGLPGVVNLVGIESPGLTSSIAIARYVKKLIDKQAPI